MTAPLQTRETTVRADAAEMPGLVSFLDGALAATGCPPRIAAKLMVCLDEIASNVMKFSGANTLTVRLERDNGTPCAWRISFIDDGTPWDPLKHDDPDISLPANERPIGGLGLLMVKKMMDGASYSREDGKNVLRLSINGSATPCSP